MKNILLRKPWSAPLSIESGQTQKALYNRNPSLLPISLFIHTAVKLSILCASGYDFICYGSANITAVLSYSLLNQIPTTKNPENALQEIKHIFVHMKDIFRQFSKNLFYLFNNWQIN
jgi:hypothetical protein